MNFKKIENCSILVVDSTFADGRLYLFSWIYKNENSILKTEFQVLIKKQKHALVLFLRKQTKSHNKVISLVSLFSRLFISWCFYSLPKSNSRMFYSIPTTQAVQRNLPTCSSFDYVKYLNDPLSAEVGRMTGIREREHFLNKNVKKPLIMLGIGRSCPPIQVQKLKLSTNRSKSL